MCLLRLGLRILGVLSCRLNWGFSCEFFALQVNVEMVELNGIEVSVGMDLAGSETWNLEILLNFMR